jgi:hypothetical protein
MPWRRTENASVFLSASPGCKPARRTDIVTPELTEVIEDLPVPKVLNENSVMREGLALFFDVVIIGAGSSYSEFGFTVIN